MKQLAILIARLSLFMSIGLALFFVPLALGFNLLLRASVSQPFVDLSPLRPVTHALVGAAIAGTTFGIIMGTINYFTVRTVSKESTVIDLKVKQSRNIQIRSNRSVAYQTGVLALKSIGARITINDEIAGHVEGKTSGSTKSAGEIVSITLLTKSDEHIEIKIQSRPISLLTLADFGKNYGNVEHIVRSYTKTL